MSDAPLPRTVEELTPGWLTSALQKHCPGIRVTSLAVDTILWGTATKVLVDAQYANARDYRIPNKLCIKGELDPRLRQQLTGVAVTGTQIEAVFYRDIGQQLGVPLPRFWYAGSEPGMGLLVLDNMAAANYSFGAPPFPWTPKLVADALDILAILHAATWKRSFPDVPWIQVGSAVHRGYMDFLMSAQHWQNYSADASHIPIPSHLDRERIVKGWQALWKYDDANYHCLVHGDAHLGNTCIDPNGKPFFIDWAAPTLSHWALDVAYFVTGALSVADRRANEIELLHHYLDRLTARGGPRLDRAEAMVDYRRHLLQGIAWCVLPPGMQSRDNVAAMGERYSEAMRDHDTLGVLGV